jgi:hypothetical protein
MTEAERDWRECELIECLELALAHLEEHPETLRKFHAAWDLRRRLLPAPPCVAYAEQPHEPQQN